VAEALSMGASPRADPIITLKEPDMSNAEMQREPAVAGTIDMKLEVD
jgi:hypothetical protein